MLITLVLAVVMAIPSSECKERTIFDFTTGTTDAWTEESDTVRSVGKSKASFVTFKNSNSQRAVFFTLLNPQDNGAGFAGFRTRTDLDLTEYNGISMNIRGQGQNKNYKIVLRHKGENSEPFPSYEQIFEVPMDNFGTVLLDFKKFKPYYRGKPVDDAEPLDTSKITMFGIQLFGGVYMESKQKGVSSLEIDWIKAYA